MSLDTTAEELLKLFPRDLPNLEVVTFQNPNNLFCVYFQKKTPDPRRNWSAYQKWLRKKKRLNNQCRVEEAMNLPFPSDFDSIYDQCSSLVKKGSIQPDDKVILEIYILDQERSNINSAFLSHIERNKDSALKGLGSEFYQAMLPWLIGKGYEFLVLAPDLAVPHLKSYWQSQGLSPLSKIPLEKRKKLYSTEEANHYFMAHDLTQTH